MTPDIKNAASKPDQARTRERVRIHRGIYKRIMGPIGPNGPMGPKWGPWAQGPMGPAQARPGPGPGAQMAKVPRLRTKYRLKSIPRILAGSPRERQLGPSGRPHNKNPSLAALGKKVLSSGSGIFQ